MLLIQIGTNLEPPVNQPSEPQFKMLDANRCAGKNPGALCEFLAAATVKIPRCNLDFNNQR
jgi:hypothetical protein